MPRVTKVDAQKKRTGRFSISVDGQYAFSLSDNDLVSTGIYLNQELSEVEVEKLKKLSLDSKALDRVYNFLSFRQRSRREIESYLRKRGHDDDFIGEVVEKLARQGLVSDEQFAASWVKDRQSLKPRSRRRLEQELRQKGVDRETIEATLAQVSDDDEADALRQIAKKKLVQTKYQDQSKLLNYLVAQGFDFTMAKRVLQELMD